MLRRRATALPLSDEHRSAPSLPITPPEPRLTRLSPIALRYVTGIPPCQEADTPEAEHPLSNAERQARYRARREAHKAVPVVRYRRPADRRTRSQRWLDTVAGLLALQAEYAAWYDALPDSLRDTPTAAALQAIVDLDLDELAAIVPPRGYGRD